MSIRFSLFLLVVLSAFFPVRTTAQTSPLRPPRGLTLEQAHQREVEIKWNPTLLEGIAWEVQLDDKSPVRTNELKITLSRLEPDTSYKVKVRMVRGAEVSEPAELEVKTAPLTRSFDDPERIPYLRTIKIDGSTKRRLPLFFTDLAVTNARIVYRVDGQEVVPDADNVIVLNMQETSCRLDVDIEEDAEHRFYLTYHLLLQ